MESQVAPGLCLALSSARGRSPLITLSSEAQFSTPSPAETVIRSACELLTAVNGFNGSSIKLTL